MKTLSDTDEIKNHSPSIGFVDLIGKGEVKLTIADVLDLSGEKLDGLRPAKPGTYGIVFAQIPDRFLPVKGLKLKFLMRKFGKKKSGWVGQSVSIYGDPKVTYGAKQVGGVKFVGQED